MSRLRAYKQPVFPAPEFYIAHKGDDIGRFRAEDWVPYEPDRGAVMCQYPGERPIILRVVRQDGNTIISRDGTGEDFEYQLIPVGGPA